MTRLTLAVLALLAAGSAQAACIYPRAPDRAPDGQTATRDEMVAAQAAVKQFNEDITAYNACLDMEMEQAVKSGNYDENRHQRTAGDPGQEEQCGRGRGHSHRRRIQRAASHFPGTRKKDGLIAEPDADARRSGSGDRRSAAGGGQRADSAR